ncbi:MAG: hypothetical protein R3B84_17355 [Zavarzinella sp.]
MTTFMLRHDSSTDCSDTSGVPQQHMHRVPEETSGTLQSILNKLRVRSVNANACTRHPLENNSALQYIGQHNISTDYFTYGISGMPWNLLKISEEPSGTLQAVLEKSHVYSVGENTCTRQQIFSLFECRKLYSRIDDFKLLRKGWDSYNAEPPSEQSLEHARRFLDFLSRIDRFPYALNPTVVGGVGFTFRNDKRTAYVEFRNTGNCHVAFMGAGKPRVEKIEQTFFGFQQLMNQIEKHLNEQNAQTT